MYVYCMYVCMYVYCMYVCTCMYMYICMLSIYLSTCIYLSGVVEVYRFAKRIHTASRGPGKKYMTPGKSEPLLMCVLINYD